MKIKFYILPLLLFLSMWSMAQPCSGLTVNFTSAESRCVATGSITVSVSGGSGNYTYKAIGPVTTNTTSSNVITGLAPGYYTVVVKDIVNSCILQQDSVPVAGSYNDPRFQLTKTDASCAGNDGTISMINQQYGRSPFIYTIVAPSPSNVGVSNSTGNFTGLTPGEYAIQLQDSCGGIQVRRITIENYRWWFDSLSVVRTGCDSANVFIRIKDNKGNINTSGTAFSGFMYGYVLNGDTTWHASYNFKMLLGTGRSLTIVVKDNCGNIQSSAWYLPDSVKPSLGAVNYSSLSCLTYTASVAGQNLTSPGFCLYNSANVIVDCNTTGVFTNLSYDSSYCIKATDNCYDTVITRCFTLQHAVPSVGVTVAISNQNCTGFTATITGQQNLTSPNYCLLDENGVQIVCNSTGVFTNIPYGNYCITVNDGCIDTLIQRCFTVTKPVAILTGYTITGSNCSNFRVNVSGDNLIDPLYCLYDNLGNVIDCNSSGSFTGIPHGSYCIKAISCGDTTNSVCFNTSRPVPSVGAGITVINRKCTTFSVGIWGQTNLTGPNYCLYNNNDSLISCNSTGNFYDIPYGSYCIKVQDACYDTTIVRCFTETHFLPSVSGTMQLLSSACTTVSFRVNGSNLTTPTYCLYNGADSLLACNTTGTFNNYPYGLYCVVVDDGCIDTSIRVCQTFAPVRGLTLVTSKSCTINNANIDVRFSNSSSPYHIEVYHPNGSKVYDTTTAANPFRMQMPSLPAGTQYKVVGTDKCGNKDSAMITPNANMVTKNITVKDKCPGSLWLNGSGDILATVTSNWYAVIPSIIKKDGTGFNKSYSSVSDNIYTFADLEPAQYIVEYKQSSCNGKVYDTVTVSPYTYPSQGQSAVYQCDNKSFSLGADAQGGVSPYTFQIIGSVPSLPAIITPPQSSAVFNIDNDAIYSLIRLRTVDACGNATLNDVSVLPLQNIAVTASNTCFYQNITLSVDTIPNATYLWYRKTTPTDSVQVGSGLTYNLPFFVPEQTGQYICKVSVNDGCVTRLSNFTLDGNCGDGVLPATFRLNGKKAGAINQLFWSNTIDRNVVKYSVERKVSKENSYQSIGSVLVHNGSSYFFNDNHPASGWNEYRLKIVYANKTEYSNTVTLKGDVERIDVYPNPVKNVLQISLYSQKATDYKIELFTSRGLLVYHTIAKNIRSATLTCPRNTKWYPGMYLLRITDSVTGISEIRKLLFE